MSSCEAGVLPSPAGIFVKRSMGRRCPVRASIGAAGHVRQMRRSKMGFFPQQPEAVQLWHFDHLDTEFEVKKLVLNFPSFGIAKLQ